MSGSRPNGASRAVVCFLVGALALTSALGGAEAFTMRTWGGFYPPSGSISSSSSSSSIDARESIGSAGVAASTLQQAARPLKVCRGSRDKEPAEYTCKNQFDWGKCNETWLIEGDYCAEICGRCEGRIPVGPGSVTQELETRSAEVSDDAMPAVGSRECGGHISYEWRLRSDRAREASGLAASRLNKHVLWTHVDGWTTKVLAFLAETVAKEGEQDFALQGQPLLERDLPDWVNKNPKSGRVDWEDIATADCPDGSRRQCLWIADTGNNKFKRRYSQVIAVVEPEITHVRADPNKRISTQYYTPNQVDKRNSQGICQFGMGGSHCNHHQCKHDETNFRKMKFEGELERTQPAGAENLWVFNFNFPGGKEKDSEALAVAPDGSRFWLFEKNEEVRGANVYESEILSEALSRPKYNDRHNIDLFSVAFLKPPCVAAGTNCVELDEDHLFSITGADLHPLGKSVTLQTYKGPFVYEFEEGRPFDVSGMQSIIPRPVLRYANGWGAEAIAYSRDGSRLWQMPEENRHGGCQKVLVMDCAQPNLSLRVDPSITVRSSPKEGGDTTTLLDNIMRAREGFLEQAEGNKDEMAAVEEEVKEVEGILDDIVDQISSLRDAPQPEGPLTCDIIPNGWGTEKNLSIPICGGPDRAPFKPNTTETYNCEDQAAWGKCEEDWLVQGNFCMGACGRCTHTTCSCPDCKRLKKPELLCNSNQVVSSSSNASNVVIFDFDDTLKLHHPARQAPEGLWAVEETVRLGYGIAIATASCHTDYVKKFLGEMAPHIFTPEFLESNAFQSCQKKKTAPIKCNLAHYNLLEKPECAVFFDDSISNEKYADRAGVKMIEVKKGVGVTKEKFRRGIEYMLHECNKPKVPLGICDPRADRQPPGDHTCKEQHRWGKCDEPWILKGDYCAATCGRCNAGGNSTTDPMLVTYGKTVPGSDLE